MDALEDIGFFCMDNIPPALVAKVAELCMQSADKFSKVAMVMDTRGGKLFNAFFEGLSELKQHGSYKILFLEAQPEVLERRYKETRRRHPLATDENSSVEQAIETEMQLLSAVRASARLYHRHLLPLPRPAARAHHRPFRGGRFPRNAHSRDVLRV